MNISRAKAEQLLDWACEQNPGVWVDHSRVVARAAETIAIKCNLDIDRAYILGLLHDIGRYEGFRELHHIYNGYIFLKNKGYDDIANICLSHSFPCKDIGEYFGNNDCTKEETKEIISFLANITYDDYDRLIQLCDAIGSTNGVCLIEVRLMDVIRRHGTNNLTQKKIEAIYQLKSYFDNLCNMNIYDLFYTEIRDVSFS